MTVRAAFSAKELPGLFSGIVCRPEDVTSGTSDDLAGAPCRSLGQCDSTHDFLVQRNCSGNFCFYLERYSATTSPLVQMVLDARIS